MALTAGQALGLGLGLGLGLLLLAAPAGAWYKHVASPRYHTVGRASGLLMGVRRSPYLWRRDAAAWPAGWLGRAPRGGQRRRQDGREPPARLPRESGASAAAVPAPGGAARERRKGAASSVFLSPRYSS